jgi:ribonuclease E
MSKSRKLMMINVTHAEESRVAVVVDGVLDMFEIETVDRQALKGNIYKGKIESVHTGLQAAFVDIGQDRAGFLPIDEVNFEVNPARKDSGKGHRIEDHLQKGQEILVQVVKEVFGTKPPTLSTYYSLPGRLLVITPYQKTEGISRKLDDRQRDRIRKILADLAMPGHMGCIVRTAGGGQTKLEIQRDLRYLFRLWENIEAAAKREKAPCLVYQERNLALRTIRDMFTSDIDEVLVDDPKTYEQVVDFFKTVMPQKQRMVKLYEGSRPIFNRHNLEEQLENIFKRRVPLPSGGAIVFDQTEALTSVDVNSGRMTQAGDIEEIALKTNLEAVEEIARQLRLRDLGGLVVIDFIDMRPVKNVRAVEKAMRDAMRRDKARYDITRLSRLGLMELSRQRLKGELSSKRYSDCPTCEGTGSIKTIEAAALQALRKVQTRVVRGDLEKIEIMLPPDVATYVLNHKRKEIASLEARYRTSILLTPREDFGRDDEEMATTRRERAEDEHLAPLVGEDDLEKIEAEVAAEQAEEAARDESRERRRAQQTAREEEDGGEPAEEASAGEASEAEGNGTRSRRRRRRRRKKKSSEEAPGEAAEGAAPDSGEAGAPEVEESASEAESAPATPGEGSSTTRRRRRRRRRRKPAAAGGAAESSDQESAPEASLPATRKPAASEEKPGRSAARRSAAPEPLPLAAAPPEGSASAVKERKAVRSSWWSRLTGKE